MTHPNLSDEINENIAKSEQLGGFWAKDIEPGEVVKAKTRNTIYSIRRGPSSLEVMSEPRADFAGGPRRVPYFYGWTPCHINGSTWGGSMLKVGFIGLDMNLEINTGDPRGPIVTTTIEELVKGRED